MERRQLGQLNKLDVQEWVRRKVLAKEAPGPFVGPSAPLSPRRKRYFIDFYRPISTLGPRYVELNARPAVLVVTVPVAVAVGQVEAVTIVEAAASAKAVVITDLSANAVRVSGSCEYHRGGQRRGGSSHERDHAHGFTSSC
jgi:hypothetical protein